MKRFLLVVCFCLPFLLKAQVLTDTALQQTINNALDNMYNYKFAEVDTDIRQIRARYPQHPVWAILQAAKIQWQYLPLKDNPAATAQFVQATQQAISLAEKRLEKDENDPEGIFFALTGHGYMALKYSNDKENMKAVNESRKSYGYMKQGFKLVTKNPEFYFTTGLYNYYVERYPLEHPVVKPLMVFFQGGDMALGLKQMDIAAKRGLFTRAESCYYLSHIYLEHESQPTVAAQYTKWLVDRYPNNPVFTMRMAESLLLSGRYQEAQPYIGRLKQMNHKLLPMPIKVFEGITQEKAEKNDSLATASYQAALKLPFNDPYTKEYHAMAYAGLARIAARANNHNQAKAYYKKVLAVAEYQSLMKEARSYVKS